MLIRSLPFAYHFVAKVHLARLPPARFSYGYAAFGRAVLRVGRTQKTRRDEPGGFSVLATSYSRTAYRRTTIGAAAFHCRVRNGNGWDHCAIVTRARNRTGSFAAVAATQARGRSLETQSRHVLSLSLVTDHLSLLSKNC